MLRTAFIAASFSLAAILPAAAQAAPAPRAQLDYFVTRLAHPGEAEPAEGLGARIMWPISASRLAPPRAWAGVFALHTPGDAGPESWRAGAQADAAVVRARQFPVEGFLSLGAGVVRESRERAVRTEPPARPVLDDVIALRNLRTETAYDVGMSVAPGIGARILVGEGAGLRADLRRVWDFSGKSTRSTELSAGVSLPI